MLESLFGIGLVLGLVILFLAFFILDTGMIFDVIRKNL